MYYTIYRIRNLINNKEYTGQHKTSNLDDGYLGSGTIIKSAIDKYGKDNFRKTILFICDSFEEMDSLEKLIVNEEYTLRENTYNIRPGGVYGTHSKSTRQKISDALLGLKRTEKTKQLMKTSNARNFSEETKQQMSKTQKSLGRKWMTSKDGIQKMFSPKDFQTQLNNDWFFGRSGGWGINNIRKNEKVVQKWMSKETKSKLVVGSKIQKYLDDDWTFGRNNYKRK